MLYSSTSDLGPNALSLQSKSVICLVLDGFLYTNNGVIQYLSGMDEPPTMKYTFEAIPVEVVYYLCHAEQSMMHHRAN